MPAAEKVTEAQVLDLLERKFAKAGNGGSSEYAFLRQLRNAAGFEASRTFDGAAVSLWPSRGFELHIFEVKTARSDWLRELKDPGKAEDACSIAERFSIVALKGVIQVEELPSTWGYIEVSSTGQSLRTVKAPPLLHKKARRETFPAGLVISMLRASGAVPGRGTVEETRLREEFYRGRNEGREQAEATAKHHRDRLDELEQAVAIFVRNSGFQVVPSQHQDMAAIVHDALRIKAAFADENHADRVQMRLTSLVAQLERAAAEVRRLIKPTDEGADSAP
jgi:hypothetical protein